jgi:hypothetical protein
MISMTIFGLNPDRRRCACFLGFEIALIKSAAHFLFRQPAFLW